MIASRRALAALGFLALLGWTPVASAVDPAPAPSTVRAAGNGLGAEELDALLRLLEDPRARAEFVDRLRLLRRALETRDVATPIERDPLEVASDLLRERLDALTRAVAAIGELLAQLPQLGDWLSFQFQNEYRRALWRNVFLGLGQALAAGALVAWLLARFLDRRLPVPRPGPTGLRGVVRDLVPTAAFAATTGSILDLADVLPATARVGRVLVAAIFAERVLTIAAGRLVLAFGEPEGLASRGAAGATLRPLLLIGRFAIFGYAFFLVAGRLGLPPDLYDVGTTALILVVAASLSVTILLRRAVLESAVRTLAGWIETDFLRRLLLVDLLAGSVHLWLVGLVWLNAALLVLGLGWGPARATLLSIAILLAAHLFLTWLDRPRPGPGEAAEREEPGEAPPLEAPLARRLLKTTVKIVAALAVLEAWGIGLSSWLATRDGWSMFEKLVRIAIVLAVSWLLWRIATWWIGGYVAARDAKGDLVYGNRVRTLATIARSAILVVIALVALTTVLAELGVQTAPLLAGAGVVGLAVGFGSQKLVQDVINGLFILLGDTIRVGDVVELGGKTGVVEAMSVRTVTLRSYNGDVHTIPFGTIDRVTNMSRDFSYWVVDLQIAYHENVDRVVSVLYELDSQMRREWPWRRLVLAPLEISGVEQLGENGVLIRGRLKTRPGEQWRVGREFNRRIKRRFDELGIEIPFPQRKVHIVTTSRDTGGTSMHALPTALGADTAAGPRA